MSAIPCRVIYHDLLLRGIKTILARHFEFEAWLGAEPNLSFTSLHWWLKPNTSRSSHALLALLAPLALALALASAALALAGQSR